MQQTERLLYYDNLYQTIRANTQVFPNELCNSMTIINLGPTVVNINNVPLNPGTAGTNNGESISFGGNRMEIFNGRTDINFPLNGTGLIVVIQKIYLPRNHLLD